jgi:hypothetical protein
MQDGSSGQMEELKTNESVEERGIDVADSIEGRMQSNAVLQEKQTDPSIFKMPLNNNQSDSNKNKPGNWSLMSVLKCSFFKWMETITSKHLYQIIL